MPSSDLCVVQCESKIADQVCDETFKKQCSISFKSQVTDVKYSV